MESKGLIRFSFFSILYHIEGNVSPVISSLVKSVDKEMKKDSVVLFFLYYQQLHHKLESRSSSTELEERGFIHTAQSSVLAGRVVELEHNFKKDTIHRELESRPDREEMVNRGLLSNQLFR